MKANPLLEKIRNLAEKHVDKYVLKVLNASAQHGSFGMDITDMLHNKLPKTSCDNCGSCCNSVSIYSLEYHRIMREIMATWEPERIRRLVKSVMLFEDRFVTVKEEKRIRCVFRSEEAKMCLIHPVRPFPCRIFGLLKENNKRECDRVMEFTLTPRVITEDYLVTLQSKLLENSEAHEPYPNMGEIHFFPFEFWFFRYAFSVERALQIYRDILVPNSTPLTKMWESQEEMVPLLPADYE